MFRTKTVSRDRPTLLGTGKAFVVGLPDGFKLEDALRGADSIRVATAFAHSSGWKHLWSSIKHTKAKVFLLAGLEFFQTEPKLLKKWQRLALTSKVQPRIACRDFFFHPKVMIVTTSEPYKNFAVVGSGNLSEGGLLKNIECSLYTNEADDVQELVEWFDENFKAGKKLTKKDIKAYEVQYRANRPYLTRLVSGQKKVVQEMARRASAALRNWDSAVSRAREYFRLAKSRREIENRRQATTRILEALKHPEFDFDKNGWTKFYGIWELGRLDPRYRDRILKRADDLRECLRTLRDETIPIDDRLSAIFDSHGRYRLRGLGLNTISKILASINPKKWPVYNSRVEAVLRHFEYEVSRGASQGDRYIAYANLMADFMRDCGAVDVLELDAFFYHYSQKLRRSC